MNPREVVVHVMQTDRVSKVLDLLGEGVGEACKTTHPHTHREVLSLNVGRADLLGVGVAPLDADPSSGAHRRAVSAFGTLAALGRVELDQLREVDAASERHPYRRDVGRVAAAGQLDTFTKSVLEVGHEAPGVLGRVLADEP